MTEATSDIRVKHRDVEIEYDQKDNTWKFELRGRSRSTASLADAKKAIDAPPPKDKKPFTRIKAFYKRYSSDDYATVEVTSVAEPDRYDQRHGNSVFWISKDGEREKVGGHCLFEVTPENEAKIQEIRGIQKNIQEQNKRVGALAHKLKTIKPVPAESEA